MNSQFFPNSVEILNEQAHKRLLKEASRARLIKSLETVNKESPENNLGTGFRQPSLLEPALSAILTAAFAIQLAFLVAI